MRPLLGKKESLNMMRTMLLSRRFEEKVNEMFMQGRIHGTTHLGIGQEAMHAGLSGALNKEDWILPNHRGHGHCIAKGATAYDIMAELFAIKDGVCQGLGGSMHIIDVANKNMGNSGIVGSAIPMAVGMALSLKQQKQPGVILPIFGDAASNRGTFHEAMNLASIWKLPVLFVCENNMYGMSVPAEYSVSVKDIADRGAGYNVPSKVIDGNDLMEVYHTIKELTDAMRPDEKGESSGPFLLECKTYRWLGHSKSDRREYRTKDEEAEWKAKCPIARFKARLEEKGWITDAAFKKLDAEVEAELEAAVDKCQDGQALTLDEALSYVKSPEGGM